MLKKAKKILTGIIASAMIVSTAGCGTGKNTAYALTVDGYQVKAGVYIYYQYTAFQEAKNLALEANENLDTDDEKALKKVQVNDTDFLQWVQDKATTACAEHVAVIKKFDEMELSLDEEDIETIKTNAESYYEAYPEMFEGNGIGLESLTEILTNSYKSQEIFDALYGDDGIEGVQEEDVKDFYIENNARVKYIDLDLHDAEGNDLDDEGRKEIDDMANDFLKRAKNADSLDDMLAEFDVMQEEYDQYVADKAAEAVEEEETEEEETTEETTEATTEATTITTTEASTDTDTASDADADEDENAEVTTTADEETASSETTTTSVTESEEEETETTTTTDPYANETIIAVVTTDEDTDEEDITYTPSKTFYDWVFNDAEIGVPEIIEDEDTLYVAVRLDITERMTDDDLWSESAIESVRFNMFSDDLQDKLDEWVDSYNIERNEKAYKRYDPFDFETEY